ncbi:protocadherin Fat 4-like [Babylonia areolata]|uniref:protocadherin Fat 4-like n=1 Tax=Babylonia areolata TaxID=304850 RepID=UPI003FD6A7DA
MMIRVGQFLGLLSCCLGLCFAAPTVTYPNPDGSTIVTKDEGVPAGTNVVTVTATSTITSVTFAAVKTSDGTTVVTSDFSVSANTLKTAVVLDFETTASYRVTLTVTDGTGNAFVPFTLTVKDLFDETPDLPAASNTFTINWDEEKAAGTQVFPAFTVTDKDAGDVHTFTLKGNHAQYFTIDPATGAITVNTKLDRDGAGAITVFNQLQLDVIDKGGNSATQTLTVTLQDINDNAPTCSPSLYSTSLAENTGSGVTVATLACTDIDATSPNRDITTYVISTGDDAAAKFTMSTNEVRTTATALNFEAKTDYTLVVHVVDGGATPKTGSATVRVLVTNVNEDPPVWGIFTPAGPTYTLQENVALGTTVVTVTATDSDSGQDGTVSYSLVSVTDSGGSAVNNILALDESTGKVKTISQLDYEASTSYTFVVKAQDQGNSPKSVTKSLTLNLQDMNDNAPVFSSNTYSATIDEANARAKTWATGYTLTATDADPTSGPLLYQITGGDPLSKFAFSTATAGLLELNAAVDVDSPAEDPYVYVLSVQVSDQGVPGTPALIDTATVTITISPISNDHDPVFGTPTPSASPAIDETVGIGTTVATLPVTDDDRDHGVSQTVTYSITGGNTDNDFTIDTKLGVVTTAKTLDFERTQSYDLVIEAIDSGAAARTSTYTLSVAVNNVNEHAPACTSYSIVGFVDEEVAAKTVTSLTCSDSDRGETLSYAILPPVAGFTVSTAGVVSTLTPLDYETTTSYTLKVAVYDSLATVKTSTVTVAVHVQPVNEFSPVFSPLSYTAVLPEDSAAGTSVQTVTATDSDQGSLHGTVRYSIVAGNGPGAFSIDSATGKITTTSVGLDRETADSHTLTVRASDSQQGDASVKTSDVTVIVTVTDVNDNKPLCTPAEYKASVTEPSVVGATVVTLTVTDDDEANHANSKPYLSVTGGDASGVFGINGMDLVLAKEADYETQTSYTLTLTVTNTDATPPLSSTCTVHVSILPFDEFPPVLSVPNHSTSLVETTAIGTVVYDADATDADKGLGSSVTFSIISGNTNDDFYCYPDTGVVVVWNQLDYDTPPQSYTLTVEAKDDGGLTGTMWLKIVLTDSNDQTPVFTQNVYKVTVNENVPTGTQVVVVTAEDTDTGVDGTVTYTAVSGNGMSLFAVNPGTGAVTTATATLDREVRRDYSLVVRASDGGTPPLTSTAHVFISLNDLNDNAPVFTPQDFIVSVSEDAPVGTTVTTVTAADADSSASNNVFTYFLAHTDFAVDPSSGLMTTTKLLDRETKASYVLNVLAPDSGAPVLTGTATVTVIIEDVNDNKPVITGTYTPSVSEGASISTIVTTIVATDDDEGENARLTYVIVSGNTDNDFVIADVNGIIQVQNSLDRERTPLYKLVVHVHDNGNPKLTTSTTVTVTVTDINDNAPVWSSPSYSFSVSENVAAGEFVGQVKATDADVSVNAALTYSVVLFSTGNAAHFTIDGASGVLRTTAILDRESTAQYSALVRVTDDGNPQLHADVKVNIAVNDLNDNAPKFDQAAYNASVTENAPVGTGVFTVTVTDDDIGVNDDVTLSIDTSTAAGARANSFFEVTSGTGVVAVKQVIDRETDASFTFTLLAVDGGTPAQTSSADVIITVVDVNDNAPVFTQTYYNTAVDYAGKCTKSIVTLTATDADTGVNGQVSYYLKTSDNDHLFQVDSGTGEFSLQSGLTAHVLYTLTVSARDGGTPTPLTAATPAVVRVDGMVPNQVVVTFRLGITVDAFLPQRDTFLQQLQVVMRGTYSTAVAKLWCAETNEDGLADVHVYFLKDDSTEAVANINAAKYYVSQETARSIFASDPAGTPASVLSGSEWSPFDITSVQPYTESQTPWAETWEGIAIITACCVVGLALVATATYMAIRYCRRHCTRYPARRILVEEGKRPPKNRVEPQRRPPQRHPEPDRQHKPRASSQYDPSFFWDGSRQN